MDKHGKLKYHELHKPLEQHLTKVQGYGNKDGVLRVRAKQVERTSTREIYSEFPKADGNCYNIQILIQFKNVYLQLDDERFWRDPKLLKPVRVYGADSEHTFFDDKRPIWLIQIFVSKICNHYCYFFF